jgi:YHS domain-containing protein
MATDPVCKMEVEPAKADYAGQMHYFCSPACHKAFTA